MLVILWEYRVRGGFEAEFERVYGPDGLWARLFQKGVGYLGTELLADRVTPGRYLTIDRWDSRADFDAFRETFARPYLDLDHSTERLTLQETLIGAFEINPNERP